MKTFEAVALEYAKQRRVNKWQKIRVTILTLIKKRDFLVDIKDCKIVSASKLTGTDQFRHKIENNKAPNNRCVSYIYQLFFFKK